MPQQTPIAAELVGDASAPLSNFLLVLGSMRMIKSPLETEIMWQVGQIASAMMTAAHQSLHVGTHEGDSKLHHRRP